MISNVSLGCDPEFFLCHRITNQYISAEGIIGGTKKRPKRISKEGHSVQEDNVLGEFNIPPSFSKKEFLDNILKAIKIIQTEIIPKDLEMRIESHAYFDWEQLNTKQAITVGCDPDYNAWSGWENDIPDDFEYNNLRTAGGHIHVGYNNPTEETSILIVKAMDLFLGIPSLILDNDRVRRELYGAPGSYRLKPYGVEYRVLSNFWIASPLYIEWVWDSTMKALQSLNSIEITNHVQKVIELQDSSEAKQIMKKFSIKLPENILKEIKNVKSHY